MWHGIRWEGIQMVKPDRRTAIVDAAYHLIAERGLERFRVRAVAQRAGMNHATLLHYFPSRETLIDAVVTYLLTTLKQEGEAHGPLDAKTALAQEFWDLRDRLRSEPNFFIVLNEFQVRAVHDPAVAVSLARMYDAWRVHLTYLVQDGIAHGQFRADLPVRECVDGILAAFRGLALQGIETGPDAAFDNTVTTLVDIFLQWLSFK